MNLWRGFRSVPGVVIFLWTAARGYRLCPWRSAYLRWRVETYTGIPAQQISWRDIVRLVPRERAQMWRFLSWVGKMRLKDGE